MTAYLLTLILIMIPFVSSASSTDFQTLYDYYFPKHGQYINTFYRQSFDATLFGSPPKPGEERHPLYFSFHGNSTAFHAFVNHPDRDGEGEFGETWANECVVLLLGLGDDRFARLLAVENRKTRERVGMVIDSRIEWDKHQFPKTRALYSYRWVPLSRREIEKRQQSPTLAAVVMLTRDEANRLKAALATDTRFWGVQVYTTGRDGRTPALIAAPKTLSRQDMSDLRHLIQQRLRNNEPIAFY